MTLPATTAQTLEDIAHRYHLDDSAADAHIEARSQQYELAWMLAGIPPGSHVAELGFGDGIVSHALVHGGFRVTILEGAPSLAAKATELHPGAHVESVLFEQHVPREPYDAIMASHVLEHVDDPVGLLRRMRTWLQPRGSLVVVVPNSESLHRRLAVLMGLQPALESPSARDVLVGHQRVYSLALLRQHLDQAGFEVDAHTGFFLKPLPNSMMINYSPQLLDAMLAISPQLPADLLANLGVRARAR